MRSKGEILNKCLPKNTAWTIEVERGVQLAMEQYATEYHRSKAENLPISDVRLSFPSNDKCFNYAEKMNLSWSTDKESGNLIYGFDRHQLKKFIQMCQGNEA